MKKKIKILGGVICAAAVLAAIPCVFYLKVLPAAVSNPHVISFVEKNVNKYTDLNMEIKNPVLKTNFSPLKQIKLSLQKMTLKYLLLKILIQKFLLKICLKNE